MTGIECYPLWKKQLQEKGYICVKKARSSPKEEKATLPLSLPVVGWTHYHGEPNTESHLRNAMPDRKATLTLNFSCGKKRCSRLGDTTYVESPCLNILKIPCRNLPCSSDHRLQDLRLRWPSRCPVLYRARAAAAVAAAAGQQYPGV